MLFFVFFFRSFFALEIIMFIFMVFVIVYGTTFMVGILRLNMQMAIYYTNCRPLMGSILIVQLVTTIKTNLISRGNVAEIWSNRNGLMLQIVFLKFLHPILLILVIL